MTATNALSVAILKRRYADGKVPRACFEDFPAYASCQKKEDFVGDDYALPLVTENPQGVGTTISNAQTAAAQSTFNRFLLTRCEYFGVARIKGQALRTATRKGDGALVDLWTNEMDGITASVMKMLEIFFFGTGNGVLGTIASGVTGATVTLTVAEDVNNFDLGMVVRLVSTTTLSPTVRANTATITGIDRAAGTLTIAAAWDATITSATNGDSIVRAGDQAISGAASVPIGLRSWLAGGTSPAALFGLTRSTDPVRLASQSFDATGIPMESAVIDLESLITIQGKTSKKKLWTNPRDVRQMKKSLGGKVTYPRSNVSSSVAGVSFSAIQFEGDYSTIDLMTSPFCPKNNAFLKDMSTFAMYSAGAAPMTLDFDGPEFLRVSTDDAYEVRVGLYGQYGERAPVMSARMTNWGA
ncbi:MAG TPA: hypothetical protein VEA38_13570 [Terriglobales bacterium]|nr:hypothetical protein [Terriglobales bacterium]